MTPYELARRELGTLEIAGPKHNAKVLAYFRDAGHSGIRDDETAWCAAFVGAMLARAGVKPTGLLTAQSYLKWGVKVEPADIREGDILVFKRGTLAWQGHVTFATGPVVKGKVKCLGGNQNNAVNITSYSMDGFMGARRAPAVASAYPGSGVMTDKPVARPARVPEGAWFKPLIDAILALIFKLTGGKKV